GRHGKRGLDGGSGDGARGLRGQGAVGRHVVLGDPGAGAHVEALASRAMPGQMVIGDVRLGGLLVTRRPVPSMSYCSTSVSEATYALRPLGESTIAMLWFAVATVAGDLGERVPLGAMSNCEMTEELFGA